MAKIKIQIKNRWTDSILFEYEKEENTIKDTLIEAVKCGADLGDASLHDADLREADLREANLHDADLRRADLRGADLSGANLHEADFRYVKLRYADLRGADLRYANLRDANLREADLRHADLSDADLGDAVLREANLRYANLRGAKDLPYISLTCPSDGAFIGWKKVRGYLVKLEIPEDAKRCSATTQICRCEFAKVVNITHIESGEEIQSVENNSFTPSIVYKVGEIVKPDSFDENRWNECSHGIHFFINKQDAINY